MSDELRNQSCVYCGCTPPVHFEDCPTMPNPVEEPREDEMAAGIIHEPGTGGDDPMGDGTEYGVTPIPEADRDHCGYVEEPVPPFWFGVSEEDFGRLVADQEALAETRQNWISAIEEKAIAAQQRDTLSRQVDSLVQRLAAAYVAQGVLDPAAMQGFVQKEILPINQVLAQIAAQPQGE